MSRTPKSSPKSSRTSQPATTGEDRWRFALESAGDGVWDWNVENNSVLFSDRWKTMLGYEPHEIGEGYKEWEVRVHPDDLPGVMEQIQAHFERRVPAYSVEFRMRCKDGRWKWILSRGLITSRDEKGRPRHIIGTHTDISAWRSAQQRESEILRMIVGNSPLPEVLEAIVRRVEAANSGLLCCLKLLDEKSGRLHVASGPSVPDFYLKMVDQMPVGPDVACSGRAVHFGTRVITRHMEDDPAWAGLRSAARRSKIASCWAEPVRNGAGTLLGAFACYHRQPHTPTAAEISAVESAAQLAAVAIDHHRALQSLRESEDRYARAIRGTTDGLWDWNLQTDELYLSPRWKEMLGFAEHELPNVRQEAFLGRLHPDDVARVKAVREAHFKHDVPYHVELRLKTKSGEYKWFVARGKARRDAKGRPVQMSGTISDIDAHKRAEEALLKSQRFNQAVLEQTSALILVMDDQGRFTHVNKAVTDLLGYPFPELLGRNPWEAGLLDPDEVPRSRERFGNLLRGVDNPPVELRIHARNGDVFNIEVRSTAMRAQDGTFDSIIITGTDITSRRRLEQEVIRVAEEEQASIGHNLHDGIGQTLTGIHSLAQSLEAELSGETKKSAARIGELLEKAVAEVRRMSHGLSPLSVKHRGLAGGLRLLADTVSTDFRVETVCEIEPDVRIPDADHEANVYRIAQEAVNNALHHGKPKLIRISLKRAGKTHAHLEVEDDGRGIRGSSKSNTGGIGLRVMRYRADLIGAELRVESTARKGVLVSCRFPCGSPPRTTSRKKSSGRR